MSKKRLKESNLILAAGLSWKLIWGPWKKKSTSGKVPCCCVNLEPPLPMSSALTTVPEIEILLGKGGSGGGLRGKVQVSIDENVIRDKPIFHVSVVDKYCPILCCQSPRAFRGRPLCTPHSLLHTWLHTYITS